MYSIDDWLVIGFYVLPQWILICFRGKFLNFLNKRLWIVILIVSMPRPPLPVDKDNMLFTNAVGEGVSTVNEMLPQDDPLSNLLNSGITCLPDPFKLSKSVSAIGVPNIPKYIYGNFSFDKLHLWRSPIGNKRGMLIWSGCL